MVVKQGHLVLFWYTGRLPVPGLFAFARLRRAALEHAAREQKQLPCLRAPNKEIGIQ